jgi:hypothetical protein
MGQIEKGKNNMRINKIKNRAALPTVSGRALTAPLTVTPPDSFAPCAAPLPGLFFLA